jgi:glycine/D-amino acid oxidase-like deaminating enzyme
MNLRKRDRVLVLGAGIQGACAALELAGQGYRVTMVDKAAGCLTRASLRNEGKIHLGFVYANDPGFGTPDLMVHAAVRFAPLFEKFVGRRLDWSRLCARPFTYLILNDSMIGPETILERFECLQGRYREEIQDRRLNYLGSRPDRLFDEIPSDRFADLIDRRRAVRFIDTAETPVRVTALRNLMASALRERDDIEECYNATVKSVERTPAGFRVEGVLPDGTVWRREADMVVNCCWEGRLALDDQLDLRPRRPWIYRLKYRLLADLPPRFGSLPSLTMILGRYGDIVIDPPNPAYLSWYPSCLRGWSDEVSPPESWELACGGLASPEADREMVEATLAGFDSVLPGIRDSRVRNAAAGTIFSWGESDIDDPKSELHRRDEIGVAAHDGYFTINTGKYTTAPLFAEQLGSMITDAVPAV